jgi:hypothetical protein
MAKRTSNSSVNSSIRQQTKSTEEGIGQLLEAQQASLGQLSSIRQLLELSKEYQKNQQVASGNQDALKVQMALLEAMKEHASSSKKHYKKAEDNQSKFEAQWDRESSQIAEAAKTLNTTGNVFQELSKSWKDKKESMREKTSISGGGLKRTVLGALNVGGVFNKAIAKSDWMSKQKEMGYNPSKEDAETAYQSSKDIKAHEAEIAKFQKKTGLTSDEAMRSTPKGRELLEKRADLTDRYSSVDKSTHRFSPTPVMELTGKTPTATAAQSTQTEENQLEGARDQQEMLKLFGKIEENTRGGKTAGGSKKIEKVKEEGKSGGLLDSVMGFLGEGLISAFKSMFSPGNILKFLGKALAIGAIIGALWEGITDGFKEYQQSGDIGKALIAGLAGIVDFLTFGLFDKDKIKQVIGDMAAWTNNHIVKPVSEFFTSMKDSFLGFISKIGIPEIKFKIPLIGKEVSIGPFYPFKDAAPSSKTPEAPAPSSANTVEQKSADNAAASVSNNSGGNSANVVNAPVTTNNNTTQIVRAPIRNQESSVNRYNQARFA